MVDYGASIPKLNLTLDSWDASMIKDASNITIAGPIANPPLNFKINCQMHVYNI